MSPDVLELVVAENQDRGQWGVMYVRNGSHFAKLGWFDEEADAVKALAEHKAGLLLPAPTGPMSKDEALDITAKIQAYAKRLPMLLREAHDRQAHKALNFPTWEAYCADKFDIGRAHSYRLINYAAALEELADAAGLPDLSPVGDILTENASRTVDIPVAAEQIREATADLAEDDIEARTEVVANVVDEQPIEPARTDDPPIDIDRETGEIPDPPESAPPAEPERPSHPPTAGVPASDELTPVQKARKKLAGAEAGAARLLKIDPFDAALTVTNEELVEQRQFAANLRAWCEKYDAALSPDLRSVSA